MYRIMTRLLNKETILYIFFGVFTTIINILTYEISVYFGIDYKISTIIAWIAAVGFAFFTNKVFVFNSKSFKINIIFKELFSFVLARIISGILDLLFMIVAVEIILMNDSIAKIISNIFVMIINYLLSKFFIFNSNNGGAYDQKKS